VQTADGAVVDSFDVYATHIYTTDASVAERETLEAVRQRIAEANAAREKPGNLAFEDSTVAIEISSGARYNNAPARIVDGIEKHMGWRADHTAPGDPWIELHWGEEQTMGRVVVYSSNVLALNVQVPEGDDWRTVAQTSGEEKLEATFEGVSADAIRLQVTEVTEDARGAAIQEVEVYAQ
jgi:hypothetical protein